MAQIQYYFPINSSNLDYYYNSGIIMPASYLEGRVNDLQSIQDDFLIFCESKFTSETNCTLEVILDLDDLRDLEEISRNFYLFKRPLPISRVKAIYFKNEEQKLTTIQGILNGAAFIPENIVHVDKVTEPVDISSEDIRNISKYKSVDFKEELERFDRYLGGLALLHSQRNEFNEPQLEYFKLLSNINTVIKDELLVDMDLDNDDLRLPYDKIFFETDKIKPLYEHITEKLNVKAAEDFILNDPSNTGIKLNENRNYNLKEINKVTSQLFVAFFNSYGKYYGLNRKDSLDSFINHLNFGYIQNNLQSKVNVIGYYFGMNKGYSAFRNTYKINNKTIDVKFHLDSKLDYYVIESIYQYSFFNIKTSSLDFIDRIFPQTVPDKPRDYESYTVLDKTFKIRKKKQVSGSFISLQNLSKSGSFKKLAKLIENEIGLAIPEYIPNRYNLLKARFKEFFSEALLNYSEDLIDFINHQIGNQLKDSAIFEKEIESLRSQLMIKQNEIDELKRTQEEHVISEIEISNQSQSELQSTIINDKHQLLTKERDMLSDDISHLLSECNKLKAEKNIIEIETYKIDNELDRFNGDYDDKRFLEGKLRLDELKREYTELDKKINELEGIIHHNEVRLIEMNDSLSLDKNDNLKQNIDKNVNQNSIVSKRNNRKKIITDEDVDNTLFSKEQLSYSEVDLNENELVNAYKQHHANDTLNSMSGSQLVNICKFLNLEFKGKRKSVIISKINKKLGLS